MVGHSQHRSNGVVRYVGSRGAIDRVMPSHQADVRYGNVAPEKLSHVVYPVFFLNSATKE